MKLYSVCNLCYYLDYKLIILILFYSYFLIVSDFAIGLISYSQNMTQQHNGLISLKGNYINYYGGHIMVNLHQITREIN